MMGYRCGGHQTGDGICWRTGEVTGLTLLGGALRGGGGGGELGGGVRHCVLLGSPLSVGALLRQRQNLLQGVRRAGACGEESAGLRMATRWQQSAVFHTAARWQQRGESSVVTLQVLVSPKGGRSFTGTFLREG